MNKKTVVGLISLAFMLLGMALAVATVLGLVSWIGFAVILTIVGVAAYFIIKSTSQWANNNT